MAADWRPLVTDVTGMMGSFRRENELLMLLGAVVRKYGEATGGKDFRIELDDADLVYSAMNPPEIQVYSRSGITLDGVSIRVRGDG